MKTPECLLLLFLSRPRTPQGRVPSEQRAQQFSLSTEKPNNGSHNAGALLENLETFHILSTRVSIELNGDSRTMVQNGNNSNLIEYEICAR
jgi:hypothetical protein